MLGKISASFSKIYLLAHAFSETKGQAFALQCRGVVYKVGCVDYNFVYYGQTDRALETRLKEHKRAVRVGDNNSKMAQHANQFVHNIDFDHATIVDKARNFHERLFFSRLGIRKVTTTRETNILLSRMSTKPSFKHARLPFVAFCWRSTRRTVNRCKAVIQLAFQNNR